MLLSLASGSTEEPALFSKQIIRIRITMEEIYMTQEEFYASVEVGEVFETECETLKCVSKENGIPQFEIVQNYSSK